MLKTCFSISSVKTLLKKMNGDFLILLRKEWRFLHSFEKRMEISPFFCEKNGDFSILMRKEWRFLHSFVFRPHSAMLFWIFTTTKKRMEKSPFSKKKKRFHLEKHAEKRLFFPISSVKTLLKKKEWRFLHSFEKRMEISPFFCEKNGDFSIFFSDPIQQCYFGFSLPQKREWRSLHSPKQKGVFTFNMLKSLFCSILSVKAFFHKNREISPFLFADPIQQITPKNIRKISILRKLDEFSLCKTVCFFFKLERQNA